MECERLNRNTVEPKDRVNGYPACKAYPNGIPQEIWTMNWDHYHYAYPGDDGVRAKRDNDYAGRRYWDDTFADKIDPVTGKEIPE